MTDSAEPVPGRIFISYRREETAYPAGWLYDRLADRFGGGQVFKDIDSIELGDDFVEVITSAVGSCDVLLALIGDRWLTIANEDGRRRLDDPTDFVRLEIEAALKRNVRVIPILVAGARMPRAAELPRSLSKLVRRQALELSPARFDFDTGRLLKVLDTTVAAVRIREERAREEAEREAAERRAREEAEREAVERRAREEAEREAGERRAREEAEREAGERRAREEAEREAVERRAREEAEKHATRLRVARERVDRAEELLRRHEYQPALAACAEVLKEFGNSADPALMVHVARARGLAKQARSRLLRRWWRWVSVVGIASALAAGIYLLWQGNGPGPEKAVEIPATQAWTDTGVDCKPGSVLEIAAAGTIYHDSSRSVGPDGNPDPDLRKHNVEGLPDTNHGALIGSIDRQQPYFPVGENKTYTCSAEGRLFLGVNDAGLDNNSGKFIATIKQRS